MKTKLFPGTIRIGCIHSSLRDDYIVIELTDKTSGTLVAEVEMLLENFGSATVGTRTVECNFSANTSRVGWKAENKTEIVELKCDSYDRKEREQAAKKALRPFEKDGWKARADDLLNHHRRLGNDRYTVTFFRHVPPTE